LFDGALTGANLGETIRLMENYVAAQRGEPAPAMSKFQQQLATGRLNLALAAEGVFGQRLSVRGQGKADLTGADLGQINLFGLLSKLLDHMLLNFTSLSLDTLQGSFTLDGDKVAFPDLRLTGARAKLEARGDYRITSDQLNFVVRVQPFGGTHTLVGNLFDVLSIPLANVLEVKLEGPLQDPHWSFVNGPVGLLRNLGGTPAASPAVLPPDKKK
jgi:hypothetical protein